MKESRFAREMRDEGRVETARAYIIDLLQTQELCPIGRPVAQILGANSHIAERFGTHADESLRPDGHARHRIAIAGASR